MNPLKKEVINQLLDEGLKDLVDKIHEIVNWINKSENVQTYAKNDWEGWIDGGINSWSSQDKEGDDHINGNDILYLKTHLSNNYRILLQEQKNKFKKNIEGLKKEGHVKICTTKESNPKLCGWCLMVQAPYNECIEDILKLMK